MNTGGDAAEQVVRLSLEGFEVAAKLTGTAAKELTVLLVSVELDEILSLSDRVGVMYSGSLAGELSGDEINETNIALLMVGKKGGVE